MVVVATVGEGAFCCTGYMFLFFFRGRWGKGVMSVFLFFFSGRWGREVMSEESHFDLGFKVKIKIFSLKIGKFDFYKF